ncbi:hypothetical protein [Hyalangium rubrum]|uniref:Outer membrane protein beta-barrel domain-containing protein n=1 Tax=Hyalangium rubrum TaxID=3103134 RepID=A0ABU5H3B3_9BACT|nr:hypothetical protein [Hyalangium sp. s54d21]MDY7227945.1 hypothetical protein [Hyalangium sp. s54d21]
MRTLLLLLLLLAPAGARAQYYEEHRAVSLLVGPSLGYTNALRDNRAQTGPGIYLDLGGSLTVGHDRDEVFLIARGGVTTKGGEGVLLGGFRSVYGEEELQTFFDLGATVRLFSGTWVGPRIGFGLRHALSDRLSLYGGLGLSLGFGSGLRMDAEGFTGLQWSFPINSR